MPKNYQKKSKDNDDDTPLKTLKEYWDQDMVTHIMQLRDIDPTYYLAFKNMITTHTLCKNVKLTNYYYSEKASKSERKWGRLVAKKGYSLQSIPKWMRRLVAHKFYHDIDIANSSYTIISQKAKKLGIPCASIENYVNNRQKWLAFGERSEIKNYFLELLFGSERFSPVQDPEFIKFTDDLKSELKSIRSDFFCNAEFKNISAAAKIEAKDPTNNNSVLKTFFSLVYQKIESEILEKMVEFFQSKEINVDVLVFDGCMIRKNNYAPKIPSLLKSCQIYIKEELGYDIILTEKSLAPTDQDLAKLNGPKDINIMSPVNRCIYILCEHGKKHNWARRSSLLFQEHKRMKGVYFVQDGTELDHINMVLKDDHVYKNNIHISKIAEWWKTTDDVSFPLITQSKIDYDIVAFNNGYYDTTLMEFYEQEEYNKIFGKYPLTFRYYEIDYTKELINAPTPAWDTICDHQWEIDVKFIFEAMIGRCLFPLHQFDNWEIMPYLIGVAGVGKSQLLQCLQQMLCKEDIAVFNANKETTFGLQSVYEKRLVVFPDAPSDISKFLPDTVFNQMISGETVNIAIKNKGAIDYTWTLPVICGANTHFNYRDEAGRFSRRCLAFPMNNPVTTKDMSLPNRLKAEIPTLLLRCIKTYRDLVAQSGNKDIWKVVPQTLRDMQNETKMKTNTIYRFLKEGGGCYEFDYGEDAITEWNEFKKAYQNYCYYDLKTKYVFADLDDISTFHSLGLTIKDINICKSCKKKATKGCCKKYRIDNRKKQKCLVGVSMKNTKKNNDSVSNYAIDNDYDSADGADIKTDESDFYVKTI